MTHGWPGSFFELLEVARRLAHPSAYGAEATDAFDVVIPSLPGFGFSDRPPGSGFELKTIAPLWLELMTALGYERFGTQGGDWGSGVSTEIALAAPERTLGVHLNFIMRGYLLGPKEQVAFEPDELAFFADARSFGRGPIAAAISSALSIATICSRTFRSIGTRKRSARRCVSIAIAALPRRRRRQCRRASPSHSRRFQKRYFGRRNDSSRARSSLNAIRRCRVAAISQRSNNRNF